MSAINSIETLRKALPELDGSDLFANCGYTLNIRQVEDLILNKTKGQAVSPLVLRMALVFASEMTYTRFCLPDGKIKPGHVVCRLGHTVTPSEPKALEALAGYFSPASEFRCGRPGEDSGFTVELSQDDADIINACDTWTLYPKKLFSIPLGKEGASISMAYGICRDLFQEISRRYEREPGKEHLVISRKCETLYNFTPRSSLTMKGAVSNYLKTLSDNRFFRRPKSLNKADRVSIDAYDIFDSAYQMSRLAQIAYSNFTQSELTLEAEQPSIQPEQPRTAQPSFSGFDFGTPEEIRACMSLMITSIDRLGDDDASIHGHALLKRLKELAND